MLPYLFNNIKLLHLLYFCLQNCSETERGRAELVQTEVLYIQRAETAQDFCTVVVGQVTS